MLSKFVLLIFQTYLISIWKYQKEKDTHTLLAPAQMVALAVPSWPDASNQVPPPGLPCGWPGPEHLGHLPGFIKERIISWTDRAWTSIPMERWHYKWQFNPLQHNTILDPSLLLVNNRPDSVYPVTIDGHSGCYHSSPLQILLLWTFMDKFSCGTICFWYIPWVIWLLYV